MATPFDDELARLDRFEVRRGGLPAFIRLAWHRVDSAPLRWNWHHEVICDRLERVSRGEIRRLLIMVPPGTTKTLTASVFWPVWDWIEHPSRRFIAGSYGDVALDAARQHRDLVNSEWFQRRWPGVKIPYQNTRAASNFRNDRGGLRFSTSVGGPLTGRHAHIHIGDDLNKAQDAMGGAADSLVALDTSWDFWEHVLPTRRVDPATTAAVLIGQRLHEKDVPGRWLAAHDDIHVLCLPMHRSSSHPYACPPSTPDMPGDDREEGELLWPEHIPEEAVAELADVLGPRHAAAQLEQLPAPEGGLIIRPEWIGFERRVPKGWSRFIQSWDLTIDETPGGSFVVGAVWATNGSEAIRVDARRGRWGFTETAEAIVDLTLEWPESAREVVIENKANGPAVANHLRAAFKDICKRRSVSNPPALEIRLFNPKGSKLARANGVTGILSGGHVKVIENAPWVPEYLRELGLFTGAKAETNDQVDETSQALTYLFGSQADRFADAMKRAREAMRGPRRAA